MLPIRCIVIHPNEALWPEPVTVADIPTAIGDTVTRIVRPEEGGKSGLDAWCDDNFLNKPLAKNFAGSALLAALGFPLRDLYRSKMRVWGPIVITARGGKSLSAAQVAHVQEVFRTLKVQDDEED